MYSASEEQLAALRASGEFEESWYVEQYPDVKLLGIDPAAHYLSIGKALGRKPKAAFSEEMRQQARAQILKTVDGEQQLTESLCLFSHFDVHNKIDDYVVEYLRALVQCGFSIVFVTTCESIADKELDKIYPIVAEVIVKRNIGRDFGSWFAGIVNSWKPGSFRRVLLANDSVYGPLTDLKEIIDDMGGRGLDLWGITDSFETEYHIQTYFVMFELGFITSEAFLEFWSGYSFEVDKRKVIENFEIGLTSFALRRSFRVGALCSYYDVRRHALKLADPIKGIGLSALQSKLTPVNASHFFWRALLQNCHCPFIKVELLRDNPSKIDDVFLWEDLVRRHSFGISQKTIADHLDRIKSRI